MILIFTCALSEAGVDTLLFAMKVLAAAS